MQIVSNGSAFQHYTKEELIKADEYYAMRERMANRTKLPSWLPEAVEDIRTFRKSVNALLLNKYNHKE
jgi:hypothetical protein